MPTRRELANIIRVLSMDAVEKAKSGHPGAPMGMADLAEVLWNDFLRHNPVDPTWPDRDRFVMSNGHGAMLLYSLLHLSGYPLPMEELRRFRQLDSLTPGHPEYGGTPGIETSTGPLGQGLANAVGMALAERTLGAQFNRDELEIVNHHTYVSVGEGCLMEGLSHEACSLAGVLGLGKLIVLFDNNQVSIDGDVQDWFVENTCQRFEAYGWHVVDAVDGHDAVQIQAALKEARACTERPSLIRFRTVIGWGAPNKSGTAACHGAPLGAAEAALVRQALNWEPAPFQVPQEYYDAWDARHRGAQLQAEWNERFNRYRKRYPELAAEFERRLRGELPPAWEAEATALIQRFQQQEEDMATREASRRCLEIYGPLLPELIGGSADLTGSNLTRWSGARANPAQSTAGSYLYYGVREFAMAAVNSGLALHRGWLPYAGTFLVFSDYARNALRMAALMKLRSIFILTHDSIGLGEDGPTHQPIEHAAALRLIPNMSLWRPCDAVETAVAWRAAVQRMDGPTCLLLSRQALPALPRAPEQLPLVARGGYILMDCTGAPELVIIATGSEVQVARTAIVKLQQQGRRVRLVSMPCTDLFDQQDAAYRDAVLPPACPRLAVEAGISDFWRKYTGLAGDVLGLDDFGKSAPGAELMRHFGLHGEVLLQRAAALLDGPQVETAR